MGGQCRSGPPVRGRNRGTEDNGEPLTLLAPAPPVLRFGPIAVTPPPGEFLQATRDAEATLQAAVVEICAGADRVIDLFAGCGTLSLPLLPRLSHLLVAESDSATLAALIRSCRRCRPWRAARLP